jgi:hypothetical protein
VSGLRHQHSKEKQYFMKNYLRSIATAMVFSLALGAVPMFGQAAQTATDTDTAAKSKRKRKKKADTTTAADAAPAAAPAAPAATSTPAPTSAPAPAAKATKTPAPINNASASDIASAQASGKVWVNTDSGVYHKGGRWYGKTKQGKFMSEDDAKKAGYHAAKAEIGVKKSS